jgi:hypothetical protein
MLLSFASGGNIGIGTSTPTAQLAVKGNGTGVALIGDSTFTNFSGISLNGTLNGTDYNFTSSVSDKNLYINRPGGFETVFREANGTTNMIIKSGGNIGIGTTTPEGLLHVNSPSGQIVLTPSGSGTETTDNIGFELRASGYVNGPYASRFVKADEGGGIPLYIQNNESGNGTTWVNNARFGSYSGLASRLTTFPSVLPIFLP